MWTRPWCGRRGRRACVQIRIDLVDMIATAQWLFQHLCGLTVDATRCVSTHRHTHPIAHPRQRQRVRHLLFLMGDDAPGLVRKPERLSRVMHLAKHLHTHMNTHTHVQMQRQTSFPSYKSGLHKGELPQQSACLVVGPCGRPESPCRVSQPACNNTWVLTVHHCLHFWKRWHVFLIKCTFKSLFLVKPCDANTSQCPTSERVQDKEHTSH